MWGAAGERAGRLLFSEPVKGLIRWIGGRDGPLAGRGRQHDVGDGVPRAGREIRASLDREGVGNGQMLDGQRDRSVRDRYVLEDGRVRDLDEPHVVKVGDGIRRAVVPVDAELHGAGFVPGLVEREDVAMLDPPVGAWRRRGQWNLCGREPRVVRTASRQRAANRGRVRGRAVPQAEGEREIGHGRRDGGEKLPNPGAPHVGIRLCVPIAVRGEGGIGNGGAVAPWADGAGLETAVEDVRTDHDHVRPRVQGQKEQEGGKQAVVHGVSRMEGRCIDWINDSENAPARQQRGKGREMHETRENGTGAAQERDFQQENGNFHENRRGKGREPVSRLGFGDRKAIGLGGLGQPALPMRRGGEKAEYPTTNVQ